MITVEQYLKNSKIRLICSKSPEMQKSLEIIDTYGLCHKRFKKSDFLDELYKFCLSLKQNKLLRIRYIQAYFLINEIEKERKKDEKTPNF